MSHAARPDAPCMLWYISQGCRHYSHQSPCLRHCRLLPATSPSLSSLPLSRCFCLPSPWLDANATAEGSGKLTHSMRLLGATLRTTCTLVWLAINSPPSAASTRFRTPACTPTCSAHPCNIWSTQTSAQACKRCMHAASDGIPLPSWCSQAGEPAPHRRHDDPAVPVCRTLHRWPDATDARPKLQKSPASTTKYRKWYVRLAVCTGRQVSPWTCIFKVAASTRRCKKSALRTHRASLKSGVQSTMPMNTSCRERSALPWMDAEKAVFLRVRKLTQTYQGTYRTARDMHTDPEAGARPDWASPSSVSAPTEKV